MPKADAYCGATPTECAPFFGNVVSSMTRKARDLRLLTFAVPELIDAALEAEERLLDEAQALLFAAIRGGEMSRRIRAAGLFLRATAQGRRRGFG